MDNRPQYMNEYTNIVDSLTPQDISNIAKKYLDLDKVALTVVHPSNSNIDKITSSQNWSAEIKGKDHREDITILNIYVSNARPQKILQTSIAA